GWDDRGRAPAMRVLAGRVRLVASGSQRVRQALGNRPRSWRRNQNAPGWTRSLDFEPGNLWGRGASEEAGRGGRRRGLCVQIADRLVRGCRLVVTHTA